MPVPKPLPLQLGEAEQADLEKLVKRHNVGQQIALRARIVLAAAEGKSNCQITTELPVSRQMIRCKAGILKSKRSRAEFLSQPDHRLVFHYPPKHASWLNQVEIWLSILVRKLLKRGSFTSIEQLKAKVLAFVDYYNRTMAKPFKWTYKGKALAA